MKHIKHLNICYETEKRKRQRAEESLSRRRDYSERFAAYRSTRDSQDGGNALIT